MQEQTSDMVRPHDVQADSNDVTTVHLQALQEDSRMLKPEVVDRIRELSGKGFGTKWIARHLNISRNTVRRYLAGAIVGYQERPAARRLDGPALGEAHRLYRTCAEGNTVVVQQELARRGIPVELRTLQRAVAPLRQEDRAKALATVRFETEPGQQLQIDFGEKMVRIAGEAVKVYLMTAVLGYSRRHYVRAFLAQRQDDWFEGMEEAFRHFGGLPQQLLCDNASPLVISHNRQTGEVVWNPGFESFCRDRGLSAKACWPRRARTKGKIERGVGYVKHNALAGRSFDSLAHLQDHLRWWMTEVADQRIHGTTKEKPMVRFERDERQALLSLPERPLAVRTRRLTRRVSADCFVDIDTIRYSVPHRYVRETVQVVVKEEHVEIWLRGRQIALHRRSDEPHDWIREPSHFEGLFRSQTVNPAPAVSQDVPSPLVRPLAVYAELVEGGRP